MTRRLVVLSLAACLLPACTIEDEALRFGFGAGPVLASGTTDRSPGDDPELDEDMAGGGFVELVATGDTELHVRVLGSRHETEVHGSTSTADLRQLLSTTTLSRRIELFDGLTLRPLLGLGFGWVDIAFASPLQRDESGAAGVITGGLELELAHHAIVGVQAWAGIFGEPDDTEGEIQSALFYVGLRF